MFERTSKDNFGMWTGPFIFKDPAPGPWNDKTIEHLKKIIKALIKIIKEAWAERKKKN